MGVTAIALLVVIPLAAAVVGWLLLRGFWIALASRRWPVTRGRVVSVEVQVKQAESDELYQPRVRYEYVVGGKSYVNDVIDLHSARWFYRQHVADERAAEYEPGREVLVRYNPRKPQVSLLKPGVSAASWVVAVLVVALLVALATFGVVEYC